MRNMPWLFLMLSGALAAGAENSAGSSQHTNSVSFYFGAHPDDWQLFMNPNAYHDVQKPSNKVVFVYVTAGDAGLGLGTGGRSQPYYLARENGAKMSVKFMADAARAQEIPIDSVASVSGHAIKRWLYRNTVSYF